MLYGVRLLKQTLIRYRLYGYEGYTCVLAVRRPTQRRQYPLLGAPVGLPPPALYPLCKLLIEVRRGRQVGQRRRLGYQAISGGNVRGRRVCGGRR